MPQSPLPTVDAVDSVPEVPVALTRRVATPIGPVSLDELATTADALDILDRRSTVLETARKRGIRLTSPTDWVLFKHPDGSVTGYCSDIGCQRAQDLLGVEILNPSDPVLHSSRDGNSFMYMQHADGRSNITGRTVSREIGGRSSDDESGKGKSGPALDLHVRKCCRANVDGRIIRKLTGLNGVPENELAAAWEGTTKKVADCHKGRGFGTGDERKGNAAQANAPDVDPPTCWICQPVNTVTLKYKADGAKGPFYFCPDYSKHPTNSERVFVDGAKWLAEREPAKARAKKAQPASDTDADENKRIDAEIAKREGQK